MNKLTLGSLFDGSGGFPLGDLLGNGVALPCVRFVLAGIARGGKNTP